MTCLTEQVNREITICIIGHVIIPRPLVDAQVPLRCFAGRWVVVECIHLFMGLDVASHQ